MRVFITGASSGIGAALALFYAAQGAQLGLVGRREQALRDLVDRLPEACSATHSAILDARHDAVNGAHHRIYPLDVRDRNALHAAAHDFQQSGPVDIVIASAGVSAGTLTEELDDFQVFREIIDINVLSMVATFEPFVAAMKQRGQGTLVGIGSVAGVRGFAGAGAYSASKAAVRAYCESLRVELAPAGIHVVTIAPGFIQTPMTARNPYRMPFLMPVDAFAREAAQAIARGRSYCVIPWQMGWVGRLLTVLPDALFDRFAANSKRKPRRGPAS